MKPKQRAKIVTVVRDELEFQKSGLGFSILTLVFSDGQAVDVPYQPWQPRQRVSLPGKWVRDEDVR